MPRDFEDLHDLEDLNDRELRDLVRQRLAEDNTLDIDDLTIVVEAGTVILTGRVGTDQERRVAEHVVSDGLGIRAYRNEIFVDPNRRATSPEAIDESIVDDSQHEGLLLGDRAVPLSPEAAHLADTATYDDEEGTTDIGRAIADAAPWIPPSSPTPEGPVEERGESGENH